MIYLVFKNTNTGKVSRSAQVVRSLVIGRSPLADIQLTTDDKGISRLHTLVIPRPDGRLDIRDLSSVSGTFVEERGDKRMLIPAKVHGGAEKGRAILTDGEKFFVGKYQVELHYEELLGEPTYHPDYLEDEEEITAITNLDDLEDS